MADSPAIIQYLRSCYEADNRQAAVSDLFHKSIRHLHFLDGEDRLLCGFLPRIPLSPETARPALTDAQLYRREKSLLYCAFPIVGSLPARGVRPVVRLCAPLLLYPAKLVEHESVINLEIDLEQQQVNLPVLADLVADEPTSDFDLDELVREFPQAPFDEDGVQSLISLLQDFIPHFDALPLTRFPQLESEEDVRKLLRRVGKQEDKLTCASACALALTPNSPNTRGVLFELEQIARDTNLSTPLRMVLGERVGDLGKRGKPKDIRVPAVLSQAQHEVLGSAASAPLTLVVGPPGTGKSYTIAALAVDHVSRGESVLIACRKHQAVDVVAKMIDGMLGPNQCVIRGGQSQHVRELKKFLGGMLQGIRSQIQRSKRQTIKHAGNPDRQLAALDRDLARREADFISQLRDEMLWGELASEDDTGFFAGFILRWRVQWLEKRLGRQPAIWDGLREYDDALATSNQLTRELLKERIDNRVERTLKEHRRDLTRFLDSLRTRSSTRQEKLFAEINPRLLFNTFPIWLTSVADAAELVPLEAETFDVAVFDEATQCDMASCLPILQRAKRAVVVGDPNQLRHISFLSNERLQHLADQHGLDQDERQSLHYRDKSFLDLVNENIESQDRVHFLNEHFRSMPQIIRFSNDRIYQNALSIMRLRPKTATAQCVFSRFVEDGRKTAGANAIEAESLVRGLIQLVESQKTLPAEVCQTIGVLSPFRDQVDLIARELEGRLPLAAFTRHDLRVGTAHAFQGDERDVMLLSLVVDKDAHHSSLRFLNQPNLFNVTITRARHQQYVFHSVAAGELPADSLLRQYLESIDSTAPPAQHQVAVADEFLNQVGDALSGDGFHVWPEYELAGVMIDLVVEKESRTLGIDLVGYPGDFGAALDLERYRILRRAGLPVLPLPHRLWRRDPQLCLRAIESRLIG